MNKLWVNLIRSMGDVIRELLTELISCSFERGFFPKPQKLACVTALFKGENKLEVNNYRSLSVNPIVDRIFGKFMFTRISKKITNNQFYRLVTSDSLIENLVMTPQIPSSHISMKR